MKFLTSLILAGFSSFAFGQLPEQAVPEVTRTGQTVTIDWESTTGLTYFVQYSFNLNDWFYLPVVETGTGSPIGYGMQTANENMFVRLHYTNMTAADLLAADFDGDTISNWDEIRAGGTGTSPLIADTDSNGIRDDGLVYAAQNDPDGVGLPASLQSDILARWDFEQLNFNPPTFSFDDKTGNGWTANAYGVFQSPEGMVSKAAQIQNGYCAVDADVLQGKTNYSISFWINLTENSLKNAANNTLMGIYGLQDYIHYVDQFNDAYVDVDTNGIRVKKVGNTEEWNLGSYIYTNHANGVHGQTFVQETDTIRWTRALGTSDDGKWHHMVVVRNGTQYSVYFDNQLVASGSFAHSNIQFTSVSNLIFGRYFTQVGSPVASTTQMQGKFDRLSIYDKVLTAADVQNLYRQDIDSDGLFDITEHATAYWNDVNHNAIFEAGEQEYAISPFYYHDANEDHDNDLASSLVEQSAGTNIADFDSDDDSLPDGWELNYGLNPLWSLDATQNTDGDGYTAAEEYAISDTDPTKPDTDNDGVNDDKDHPPKWVSIDRSLEYDYDDYGPSQPNAPKKLKTKASWAGAVATDENLAAVIPYNQLHTRLGQKQPFPAAFPNNGLDMDLIAKGDARTVPSPPCYHATLNHKQVVVKVGAATNAAREFTALLLTERVINGTAQAPNVSSVTLTVPAGQTQSSSTGVEPTFTGTGGNGSTNYREIVNRRLSPVEITEVRFGGTKHYTLKSDDTQVTYNSPHWLDKDGDGNPSNVANGERNYPTAYASGTKPEVKAIFKIQGLDFAMSQKVKIRATGNDGIQFPEKTIQVGTAVGTWTYPITASSTAWNQKVKFYDKNDPNKAFKLNWEIKADGGNWAKIATTSHTVYVTLNEPSITSRLESLFYLGCKNADGKTTNATARTAIYSDFGDQKVTRLDGKTMHYYLGGNDGATNADDLLKNADGNGNCAAWADLFMKLLHIQGIDALPVNVTPKGTDAYLIVKNVTFKDLGLAGSTNYDYRSSRQNRTTLGEEVVGIAGIPGQGPNAQPLKLFTGHCIVKSGGKYYDPSYGIAVANTAKDYENSAFAGYAKDAGGSSPLFTIHARKNNTTSTTSEVDVSN